MEKELITALALGIGLAAATGFRVFLPLLIAGIASRMGFLPLNDSFQWVASNAALGSFGVATIVEIVDQKKKENLQNLKREKILN